MNATTTRPNLMTEYHHRVSMMIALELVYEMRANIAAYQEDVDEWYRAGEGRPRRVLPVDEFGNVTPGLQTHYIDEDGELDSYRAVNFGGSGHRYPTCFHGSSLWTDYDNICGPCEDGDESNLYLTAYNRADAMVTEMQRRANAWMDVLAIEAQHPNMPRADRDAMIAWVNEPTKVYYDRGTARRNTRRAPRLP